MVILITLLILFSIFFFVKKHIGPATLAVIAGLSVYEVFGRDFVSFIARMLDGIDTALIANCVYIALVIAFPLFLYFRSAKGGLFGPLRLIEASGFAALLTTLLVGILLIFFPFDKLSLDILNFLNSIKGFILLGSILAAYLDILFYQE